MVSKIKKSHLLILFLIVIQTAFAQSIGITPKENVITETYKLTNSYFSVSQGADFPEKITIEGNYPWLEVETREFILDPNTQKLIKTYMYFENPGKRSATLKICGRQINEGGEVLSTKACASHRLTVDVKWDLKTKIVFVLESIAILMIIFTIVFLIIKVWRGKIKIKRIFTKDVIKEKKRLLKKLQEAK